MANDLQKALPKRSEVPVELTWRLEDIFADADAWEKARQEVVRLGDELAAFAGKVAKSAENLLAFFEKYEELNVRIDSLYAYASMSCDQDTANPRGQELKSKALATYNDTFEKISFLEPEVLELSQEQMDAYYAAKPELMRYEVSIKEILRQKPHTLSKEMEALLASAGNMAQGFENSYEMLSDADLKFPAVKDGNGEEIQLSNGRFVPTQMSADRVLRKNAFEALYSRYKEFGNTWAAIYNGQVQQQIFYAKARKYGSTFECAVDGNNVDPSVCDNLIESVHRGLDKMHRYVRLRKKMLGVDELHMYDVYTPIVKDYEVKVSYEEAKALTLEALKPLGEDYLEIVRKAYADRWIDVLENDGKRGGAYSGGTYAEHPYMLLNYNSTLDDVFTLIHEMGHSMHTWYSNKNNSILNAGYKIFVAEVASTTNEVLLLEYMLKKAESVQEKAYLVNHYLESFKGTLFRQTMFEEFERKTNKMAEEGIPLTFEALSNTYMELNKMYFGDAMVSDDLIAYEWCRIPHFYYNFYVYQYATSFSAAVAIAHRILEGDASVVEQYKKFLSSGCTQDPVSLLKIAGVDMSTGKPVDEALEVFEKAVEDMEKLAEEM
ncbi:MAG: oligoendopeptidase F [Lachnospiraceae bacterium]|nr:oligoendopeptidase F [Lachnospiraceae bacterium]